MDSKTCFKILEIPPTKDEKIVRKAYHKLALKYHPDINSTPHAKKEFIKINDAYEQLITSIKKLEKQPSASDYKSQNKKPTFSKEEWARYKEYQWRQAQKKYEQFVKEEEAANQAYYTSITTGKKWLFFRIIMWTCLVFLITFITDSFFLTPTISEVIITQRNNKELYTNLSGKKTIEVETNTGKTLYLPTQKIGMIGTSPFYLQITPILKEVKRIKIWKTNHWVYSTPNFTLYALYPLIILLFLFPLITRLIKSFTPIFNLCFQLSLFLVPLLFIGILIMNNRWLHWITLGFL